MPSGRTSTPQRPCRMRKWFFSCNSVTRGRSPVLKNLRWPLRLLAGLFGIFLLACLIRRAGPNTLRQSVVTLGWRISLVIALGGAAHLIKTWAWRITLLDEKQHVSYLRMLALRLGSEAV